MIEKAPPEVERWQVRRHCQSSLCRTMTDLDPEFQDRYPVEAVRILCFVPFTVRMND